MLPSQLLLLQSKDYFDIINGKCCDRSDYVAISYKKLWKLLIDRDLKKKDLRQMAGISASSITKLGKDENVNTEILERICKALDCDISDIMEMRS